MPDICTLDDKLAKKINDFLDSDYIFTVNAGNSYTIEEEKEEGRAFIECTVASDSVFVKNADKKVFSFLDVNGRNDCRKCADAYIFVSNDVGELDINVIEIKKTVNLGRWREIQKQLEMGLYNAQSIMGFLGASATENVNFYVALQKDIIPSFNIEGFTNKSLIELRATNGLLVKDNEDMRNWHCNRLRLSNDGNIYNFNKILLNNLGYGTLEC